jgi:hypothetical protein
VLVFIFFLALISLGMGFETPPLVLSRFSLSLSKIALSVPSRAGSEEGSGGRAEAGREIAAEATGFDAIHIRVCE